MRNFSINKEDLEYIERLLKINTNINKIYSKLCTLEIEGKKSTEEYTKQLEYLSIFIEEEEKLYNKPNITTTRLLSWAKFIFEQKRLNSFDIKENLMNQNYDNKILTRVINTILSKITKNYNNLVNLSNKELINIMTMFGMNITKKLSNDDISKRIIIKNNIENDIYRAFLSLLQEQMETPNQKLFKNNLITAKYNTIFINRNIESHLLTNNFTININTYINSDIVSDLLQIEKELNTLSKNILGVTIANQEIYELLEISDIDYNDITKVTTSILRQCMLNASLLFISDDMIEEIKNIINEFIQDIEYENIHPNNTISNILINNCFNTIKKNKEKMKTLSLK